jgi:hypothetical protein
VDLEAVPPIPPTELELLEAALARAGVDLDARPGAYESAWRRAGIAEAAGHADGDDGYTPSPRSTRGATRA